MTDIRLQRNTYMPGLDGLRALAVFAVFAFHLSLPFAPGGFLGVTLFFVLSGYLITDLLLSEWAGSKTINFKDFYIRRGKRLLPSIYFLLICVTAYISFFAPGFLENFKSDFLPAAFSFSNWWFIFNKIPYFESFASPSLLTHFWSLAVEVQFYLIWPFLVYLLQRFVRRKWLRIAVTAALAAASAVLLGVLYEPGGDPGRIYYGTDTRVFSLLIGACMAYILPSARIAKASEKKSVRVVLDTSGLISLPVILFMCYYITQYDDFLYYGGMFLFSVISALLVAAAAAPSTVTARIFSFRPLRFIGKISYGFYLWQFPVIVITNSMFESSSINILLCLFQVAATIVLATASYYLIEMPFRKKKILKAFRNKSFGGFCRLCLHMSWQSKTAALLVLALLLTSGIGMLNAKALPSSDTGDLSSVSEQNLVDPPEETETPVTNPSPSAPPSDTPVTESPPISASPSTDVTPGSTPVISIPPDISASPADASAPPAESAEQEIISSGLCVTVIGDSVGIGITPYLEKYYPNMTLYAEVGQQFYQAKTVVKELLQKNKLESTVIIELGSNGAVKESHMRELIELIGSDRKIVFVNTQVPRSWCAGVNSTLEKVSAEYDNTAIADWFGVSTDKKEYFYKDGVHTNSVGAPVLAKLIADTVAVIQPYKPYLPLE
ncbi:MAG: acyltransferase family protein [Clostridiales bacterium]|nr:acyltransferase family protein [Clostridiales bacterium]